MRGQQRGKGVPRRARRFQNFGDALGGRPARVPSAVVRFDLLKVVGSSPPSWPARTATGYSAAPARRWQPKPDRGSAWRSVTSVESSRKYLLRRRIATLCNAAGSKNRGPVAGGMRTPPAREPWSATSHNLDPPCRRAGEALERRDERCKHTDNRDLQDCAAALWAQAEREGVFHGAPVDLADGYIHFSTAAQARELRPNILPADRSAADRGRCGAAQRRAALGAIARGARCSPISMGP